MRRPDHITRLACSVADGLAATSAAGVAYFARFQTGWIAIEGRSDVLPARYLEALPVTVAVLIAASAASRAYAPDSLRRPVHVGVAIRAALLGGVMLAALALGYRDAFQYSRLAVAFVAVAYVPCMLVGRWTALLTLRRLAASGRIGSRAAVIGGPERVELVRTALRQEAWPATLITHSLAPPDTEPGFVGAGIGPPEPDARSPVTTLPNVDALMRAIAGGELDEIILATRSEDVAWTRAVLRRLEDAPIDVHLVPDIADEILVNPAAVVLGGVPILSLRQRPLYGARAALKRTVDVTVSGCAAAALALPLLALAAAVRLTSAGPALYRQRRTGLDGREFEMLKFRTMQRHAESVSGPQFATPGDARVTRLGRLLRRFSLDELPQIWNVLRGDMSLVGPRPERPEFIESFRAQHPGYMLRLSVKAGMTGWAQVHGLRGDTPLDQRLRMDLEYIDRWSLWLDLEILARTFIHVLRGTNAY